MMRLTLAVVVISVVLMASVLVGHAAPLEGAATLGDGKFTVHLDGVLVDVLAKLSKLTKHQVWLEGTPENGEPPEAGQKLPAKAVVPVKLDFENAPLAEIVGAVCKQAGVIGEVEGARYIRLHEGDPNLDARPTVEVGDYVLRIKGARLSSERSYGFDRGQPVPEVPEEVGSLELSLTILSKSRQADLLLAGIGTEVKATTDKGGVLKPATDTPPGEPGDAMSSIDRASADSEELTGPQDDVPGLSLTEPPAGVRKLTRVEGTLYLYSAIKTTALKITPADKGKPVKQDDVTVTLSAWKLEVDPEMPEAVDTYRVEMALDAPSLLGPAKAGELEERGIRLVGVLVGKDGSRRRGSDVPVEGAEGQAKPGRQALLFYAPDADAPADPKAAKFEPDHLLLTVVRNGPANKIVPFVFENVPVP